MTDEFEETQTVLPAVAQVIIIELADYIERENGRIDLLEEQFTSGEPQRYMQRAFSFLHEVAINENEIAIIEKKIPF
jgi:hypothetical protein